MPDTALTNKQIARVLKEAGTLVDLTGGNSFRARAFTGGARKVENLDEPVAERLADGTLTEVRGIGAGLAEQITEIVETGTFAALEELRAEVPVGVRALLGVPGLGAKKVRTLWQERNLTSLEQLEDAARAGHLRTLSGFGKKTEANIAEAVAQQRRYAQRRRYAEAFVQTLPVLDALRSHDAIARAEVAGTLRRKLETVAESEVLVALHEGARPETLADALAEWDAELRLSGDTVALEGALPDGLPLHVRVVPAERFGTAWWWMTGSEEHTSAFAEAHGAPEAHADEDALYEAAGLPAILPELREGQGELGAAADGALPRLVTVADLRGTLHNHSTYSDGTASIHEMAEAARAQGLEYFGLCDHSQTLTIASGLSPERVREQAEEVRALNQRYEDEGIHFRIFHGIESDILEDGSLDYDEDTLALFDFVVASVHGQFGLPEEKQTERLVRAAENPHTRIVGHLTGRLLLRREGYSVDPHAVIEACARTGTAIELNANPYRLDLDWRLVRAATERGVLIAINPDAHSTSDLDNLRWGVAAARKGWLTAEQTLNAKSLDAFTAWLG